MSENGNMHFKENFLGVMIEMKKRGPQQRQKKTLSAKGLLGLVKNDFESIKISKGNSQESRGKPRTITIANCLMSGLAVFSLKYPSLVAFDQHCNEKLIRHNLRTLYKIKQSPCDTYMREQLDEVDPKTLRKSFLSIFDEVRKGKLLEQYRFLDGYLIAIDGTQIFHSEDVHCDNCCQKIHRDGRITYYHQMVAGVIVHPQREQVLPLCPEPISKRNEKNGCERNAAYRFLHDLKREHPRLRGIIVSDALAANTPQINEIKSLGYGFIINVKLSNNCSLLEWLQGVDLQEVQLAYEKNRYRFRYINGVPLNGNEKAPSVNFLECEVEEVKGRKIIKKKFSWVTDRIITRENVFSIMQAGRARWKIENETFNTLKNRGYQFEHNFGHGKKNRSRCVCSFDDASFLH